MAFSVQTVCNSAIISTSESSRIGAVSHNLDSNTFSTSLQVILTNYTNILYVDTDVIFLNELSDIWSHVGQMNATQMAALVPEHEDPNVGWYSRFARHPFYGKLGRFLMNVRSIGCRQILL